MQFIQNNEWYRVVRITGPSHNILGIVFAEKDVLCDATIESLPAKDTHTQQLSSVEVRQNVIDGVAHANRELGTNYIIAKIQFVPTDSSPPSIYHVLAKMIVERRTKQEVFSTMS